MHSTNGNGFNVNAKKGGGIPNGYSNYDGVDYKAVNSSKASGCKFILFVEN